MQQICRQINKRGKGLGTSSLDTVSLSAHHLGRCQCELNVGVYKPV